MHTQSPQCFPFLLCRVATLPFHLLDELQWRPNDGLLEKYLENQHQQELSELQSQLEDNYLQRQRECRTVFTKLAAYPELQKGLLLSSPSLWENVNRYRYQSPPKYRKKERQTERSLAQYLSRICAKTSPFGTFTALSLNDLSGRNLVGQPGELHSEIRINNYIWVQLQDLLSNYPPVYRRLGLKTNPTLREMGDGYLFLLNSRNVESVQRMEKNPVVEEVLEILKNQKGVSILLDELTGLLSNRVDADARQLEIWLVDLVRYGLLNWVWPVADAHWLVPMRDWIHQLPPFAEQQQLAESLRFLEESHRLFAKADTTERWQRMRDSRDRLNACFEAIAKKIPLSESVRSDHSDGFQAFRQKRFSLEAHQLFFEDCRMGADMQWGKKTCWTAWSPWPNWCI